MAVVPTGKKVTSTAKLPIIVEWKCSSCGAENRADQVLEFQATGHGSLAAKEETLRQRAHDALDQEVQRKLDKIMGGEYRDARLNCKCSSCSHAEPWANYRAVDTWVGLIALLCFAVALLARYLGIKPALFALIPGVVILLIDCLINAVINSGRAKKAKALPAASQPRILLRK